MNSNNPNIKLYKLYNVDAKIYAYVNDILINNYILVFTIFTLAIMLILAGFLGCCMNKTNILNLLLFLELIYLGLFLFTLSLGFFFSYFLCYIYAYIILIIAAAETSFGLTLIILNFRITKTIQLTRIEENN
jgi:NADH:ubiquinone oxidoreductase subunit K